jgi:hypothetical protein
VQNRSLEVDHRSELRVDVQGVFICDESVQNGLAWVSAVLKYKVRVSTGQGFHRFDEPYSFVSAASESTSKDDALNEEGQFFLTLCLQET